MVFIKMKKTDISILIFTIISICTTIEAVRHVEQVDNVLYGTDTSYTFEKELQLSLDKYILRESNQRLQSSNNKTFMIRGETGEEFQVQEFLEQSTNLAAKLRELGSEKDTVVAIMSENRFEYPVVILATMLTGAIFTGFNPSFTTEKLEPIFKIARPKIVFCTPINCLKIIKVSHSSDSHIIVLDSDEALQSNLSHILTLKFSQLIQSSRFNNFLVKNNPNDVACILYSSGTTGPPKGVELTHRNILFTLKLLQENIIENNGPINLSTTPMCHISGLTILLAAIPRYESLVVVKEHTPELLLSTLQKYDIKRLLITPGMITFLLKTPSVSKTNLSNIEFIVCGAGPIRVETEEALMHKFDLKYIQQIYGMTESTMFTTVKDPRSHTKGTCGSPVPGIQMKVVDTETGRTLGKNERGEIYIRGLTIAKGYYKNEEATAQTIDKDGWLHSGDIGYYDADGNFFIVDRAKELLKVYGSQVSPAEIEATLLKHSSVADAAVIGIPDVDAGDLPYAFVVKQDGVNVSEKELFDYVAELLSSEDRLKGGIEFISKIPKNSTGKIMRGELRDNLLEKHPERKILVDDPTGAKSKRLTSEKSTESEADGNGNNRTSS